MTRSGEPLAPPAETVTASQAFHLFAKPTGAVFNLDCDYCFLLSEEMLYPGSRFWMADELLKIYIRQLIEAHARAPVVEVARQGGTGQRVETIDGQKRGLGAP